MVQGPAKVSVHGDGDVMSHDSGGGGGAHCGSHSPSLELRCPLCGDGDD